MKTLMNEMIVNKIEQLQGRRRPITDKVILTLKMLSIILLPNPIFRLQVVTTVKPDEL